MVNLKWIYYFISLALVKAAPARPQSRLSLADWTNYNYHEPQGPGTYAFGYDVEDVANGNVQFRNEERLPNGTVIGSYGYVDPDGVVRITNYIADQNGYRANQENRFRLSMLRPLPTPELPTFLPQPSVGTPVFEDPQDYHLGQNGYNQGRVYYNPHLRPSHNFLPMNQFDGNNFISFPESDLYENQNLDYFNPTENVYFPNYEYPLPRHG